MCSRWKDRTLRWVANVVSATTDHSNSVGKWMLANKKVDDNIVADISVEEGCCSAFAIWIDDACVENIIRCWWDW